MDEKGWANVEYRLVTGTTPAVQAFVGNVASMYANGGCLIRKFEPLSSSGFDLALRNDLQGLGRMLSSFLGRPEVRAALSEIRLSEAAVEALPFRAIGAFEFEGALTQILLWGGAYNSGMTEEPARLASRAFVDELIGDRGHAQVFAVDGAWTSWFHDVAWDYSFIVLDADRRAWWTLFMTDTD
jgi:hypothetical protein